jgi:hypothetical protein
MNKNAEIEFGVLDLTFFFVYKIKPQTNTLLFLACVTTTQM